MDVPKTCVILGGGWGGLAAAHELRDLVSSENKILVIERSSTFSLGFSNLQLMTGERESVRQIQRGMAKLKRPGIEWIHAEVQGVDPEARTVDTDAGIYDCDYLVLALGAELAPESITGFSESAHNLYDANEAAALHTELKGFEGGQIVILIAGAPFRCPAAPYEAAMLVEAWTRDNGIREKVDIDLYTPESIPMAVAGPVIGQGLCDLMDQRQIAYHFGHQVTKIDAASRILRFEEDEKASFDLLIGVPPHRAPSVLRQAGLVDASGYVPVHPKTLELLSDPDRLETPYPGVYAIGDVTAIRLQNSMLLPKAGEFAQGEAHVVAATIAADINKTSSPGTYDGNGGCYVDVGGGLAAYGAGDFYASPGPKVTLEDPSTEARKAKQKYEHLLDNWFLE